MCFSQESIIESFVKKKIKIDKVIKRLLKVTTPTVNKKYMVSRNIESLCHIYFFYEILRAVIDACENDMLGWYA